MRSVAQLIGETAVVHDVHRIVLCHGPGSKNEYPPVLARVISRSRYPGDPVDVQPRMIVGKTGIYRLCEGDCQGVGIGKIPLFQKNRKRYRRADTVSHGPFYGSGRKGKDRPAGTLS